jgi:hypothetical protein
MKLERLIVKNTGCFSREPRSSSQYLQCSSQPPIAPILVDLSHPFLASVGTEHTYNAHICRQNIHICEIIFKKKMSGHLLPFLPFHLKYKQFKKSVSLRYSSEVIQNVTLLETVTFFFFEILCSLYECLPECMYSCLWNPHGMRHLTH